MNTTNVLIRKRITKLFMVVSLVLLILIVRLAWLQIVQGEELGNKALVNRLRDVEIPAKRGNVYDRNGKELAVSVSSSMVVAYPTQIDDPKKTAEELSKILNSSYERIYKKVAKKSKYEEIKLQISSQEEDAIKKAKIPGIYLYPSAARDYPNGNLAAHVLGAVGIDGGLDGIEKTFNKELSGTSGKLVIEKDASGREIPQAEHDFYEPVDGNSLVLTIDEIIQHIVERELDKIVTKYQPQNATIVVMEPKTGRILALGNRPDFNPTDYRKLFADGDKEKLKGLRNPAVMDTYEPGSTFKVVTLSAAIEEGVFKGDKHFTDPGFALVNGKRIKCWKAGGHGSQTFKEVVQNSCNPGFISLGLEVGKDKFYKYIRGFGFGQPTNINLNGEAIGLTYKQKDVTPINLATMSIGQSISVTPIQLLTAVSAVANGGQLMKPQLVQEIKDSKGKTVKTIEPEPIRQVISQETSKEVAEILEGVVAKGTGKRAYIEGYRVAGKTGTAQKAIGGKYVSGKYIASFAGFAPANDPQIAMIVIINEPKGGEYYGGVIAAPVFGAVAKDVLRYLKVAPQVNGLKLDPGPLGVEEVDRPDVNVPNVVNLPIQQARKDLTAAGFKVIIEGNGNVVRGQLPEGNIQVPAGTAVILYSGAPKDKDDGLITVPDIRGKTMREAAAILGAAGLYMNPVSNDAGAEPTGFAIEQDVTEGRKVKTGTVITVKFSKTKPPN